jgi:iron complex outermembrane receptor protein
MGDEPDGHGRRVGEDWMTRGGLALGGLGRRMALLAGALAFMAPAQAAFAAEHAFSIPAQGLATGLQAFGEQSGVTILYRPDLTASARTPGVRGQLEPEAALDRLLSGSGFEFRKLEEGFVVVPAIGAGDARGTAGSAPAQALPPSGAAVQADAAPGLDLPVASQVEQVVVTGSIIRGVTPPVGANFQTIGSNVIARAGATSGNQLLAGIPIVSNLFNTVPATPSSVFLNVFRPLIRNIPASGGSTTLVMLDGHSQVGVGTLQTTADPGMIPIGVIERVEILADGGSALYGTDAVTGIVNYITRTRFDGLEISSHHGAAGGGYHASNLDIIAGRAWPRGSLLISAEARENSPLYSDRRSRPRQNLTVYGGSDFRVRTCALGNITAAGVNYALPALLPGTLNLCDGLQMGNIAPQERHYGAFASLTQEIGDDLRFEMKGLWSDRVTKSRSAQLVGRNLTITSDNPFFRPIAGETAQIVNFSFSPYLGLRQAARSAVKQYSLTPQLVWSLPADWQIRGVYNRGWSRISTELPSVTPNINAYLNGPGLTTATALNPYDLLATSPRVLSELTGVYRLLGYGVQTLNDVRGQADGPIFGIPGGAVRAAVGLEAQHTTLHALAGVPAVSLADPLIGVGRASRRVSSAFGQLVVPLVGPQNALAGMRALTLDFSARIDRYSDFGTTRNPKFAFTWKVADALSIRGNWGTSFNAPSLADTTGDSAHRVDYSATTVALAPGASLTVEGQRPSVSITGGNPALKPQTAHTWSVGADIRPPGLERLAVALSFWSISIKDIITMAPRNDSLFSQPAFKAYYTLNPTLAQVQAIAAGLPLTGTPTQSLADLYGHGLDPYILIDVRKQNFGAVRAQGVDFQISYRQPLAWGAVFASAAGTRPTKRAQRATAGGIAADLLAADNSKLSLSSTLGVTVGRFTASATQNFSQGYRLATTVGQSHIGDFAPINLAFRYAFDGASPVGENLDVTLNIDNLGDAQPPFQNVAGGTGNGSTLGRYINLGIQKRF